MHHKNFLTTLSAFINRNLPRTPPSVFIHTRSVQFLIDPINTRINKCKDRQCVHFSFALGTQIRYIDKLIQTEAQNKHR